VKSGTLRKEDISLDGGIISFDQQFLFGLGMQLLNTLILFAGLSFLLFKPVREFMEKRSERIRLQIEQAKSEEQRVLEMKKEYENKLTNIKEESDAILREARKKAQEQESQIIEEARKEADSIKNRVLTDIEREKVKVKDEMKKEMVEIASLMAGKLIASSIDEQKHSELIDEVISQMGDVSWHN
jgi:F-type H+-transporting ATPase subunit b